MGGTARTNKAKRTVDSNLEEPWFKKNRNRQRKRDKMAKQSRRKNRKK